MTSPLRHRRILLLSSSFPPLADRPSGSFVYDLAARLSQTYDIIVSAPHARGAKTFETMGSLRTTRFRYWAEFGENLCYGAGLLSNLRNNPWRYLQLPFFFCSWIFAALRLVRRHQPDFIHAHWTTPAGVVAAAILVLTGTPFIVTIHGSDARFNGSLVQKLVLRAAAGITVVNLSMREALLKTNPNLQNKNILVRSMGVDSQLFSLRRPETTPLPGEPAVLFVGWLDNNKGLEYLIRAVGGLGTTLPKLKLHIVGEGPRQQEFKVLVSEQGIAGQVIFHGALPHEQMPAFYQGADIFVLPSLSEGLPVSVVEAQACGCAVLATAVGGVPTIVADGVTGILAKPKNPTALASGLQKLSLDPTLRLALTTAARRQIEESYDWQRVSETFATYFDQQIPKI